MHRSNSQYNPILWEFANRKRRDILKRPHSEGEFDVSKMQNPQEQERIFSGYRKQGRFLE